MGYCGIYANDSFRSRSVPNKMQLYTAPVEGDRIDRVIQAKAEAEGVSENQTRDEMMSGTTLNTFIPKNHISSMILYLCSEAGSTITGQAISVDGGLESVP